MKKNDQCGPGNVRGWTFDTLGITGSIVALGIIVWVRTLHAGDTKAVDAALVSTKATASEIAASTTKEFDGVRAEIKELAKGLSEGLAGLNSALKLMGGLAALITVVGTIVGAVFLR